MLGSMFRTTVLSIIMAPDVPTMVKLGREASAKKLSVREVERRARGTSGGGSKGAKKAGPPEKSANVRDLERRLSHTLGAPVRIEQGKGEKGVVAIEYADFDQLDALLAKLGVGG